MRLEISRRADLAVRALVVLAGAEQRMKADPLATALATTTGFVPQIVGPLVKRGWVQSDPGPKGGYAATVDLETLNLLEVIEAVEGPTDIGRCVVADRPCAGAAQCALHEPWGRARGELLTHLAGTSLAAVAAGDGR